MSCLGSKGNHGSPLPTCRHSFTNVFLSGMPVIFTLPSSQGLGPCVISQSYHFSVASCHALAGRKIDLPPHEGSPNLQGQEGSDTKEQTLVFGDDEEE